ncbi:Arc family DNA-binding protein [Moraxella sp. VT-16-12]|uniref:Arc family DNA-binding protein n=1 Tax=Moraxella sp. VT-16-12 TaxID=2014877 RepID=UPI000B7F6AA6|nr:Arc family DNA-binding protein [Moraxella sp. VT-16-12]TWV82054.1 Arc family DNA-binding protein [Moraxella sp. VT-16-12]
MSEKNYYEQTDAQFKIRLPHDLKDKIRASADEHNRTMTADIVARLEQSFEKSSDQNDMLVQILSEIQSLKGATS